MAGKKYIIVEGSTDADFFQVYLKFRHKIEAKIIGRKYECNSGTDKEPGWYIQILGGKDKLDEKFIRSTIETSLGEIQALFIILDSDNSPKAGIKKIASLSQKLFGKKIECSTSDEVEFSGEKFRFGYCLIPECKRKGNLESMICEQIRTQYARIYKCLEDAINCADNEQVIIKDKTKTLAYMYASLYVGDLRTVNLKTTFEAKKLELPEVECVDRFLTSIISTNPSFKGMD